MDNENVFYQYVEIYWMVVDENKYIEELAFMHVKIYTCLCMLIYACLYMLNLCMYYFYQYIEVYSMVVDEKEMEELASIHVKLQEQLQHSRRS